MILWYFQDESGVRVGMFNMWKCADIYKRPLRMKTAHLSLPETQLHKPTKSGHHIPPRLNQADPEALWRVGQAFFLKKKKLQSSRPELEPI